MALLQKIVKFKSEESKKKKNNVVLKENKKKDIKINMICVMRPLNIYLHILRIHTCKYYAIAL